MKTRSKVAVGCLGLLGLAVVGLGVPVALNWDAVSRKLGNALDAQTEKTRTSLFRLGELMSIGAELKDEYGTEPEMAYDTDTGDRVLSITFDAYELPGGVTARDHAREIASFAVGRTKKFDEIDVVRVLFRSSGRDLESSSFKLDELMPAP